MFVTSRDGAQIHYEVTGDGEPALVFVHGWLGNLRWWDAQRDALAAHYRVVALDLAGHGESSAERPAWTAEAYADDIAAVVRALPASRVVLVAHSMAGVYALAACPQLERVAAVILVDTVKDLDAIPTFEQVAPMLASYRADFLSAVENFLPQYLFGSLTPPEVSARLTREFLAVPGDVAAQLIEPLYRFDVRAAARQVRVPVRGIGCDETLPRADANRAYLADYAYVSLGPYGHYPMLEAPSAFTAALHATLGELGFASR